MIIIYLVFIIKVSSASEIKSCTMDSQCDVSKGQACISKTCQCKNTEQFWDGKNCGNFCFKNSSFFFLTYHHIILKMIRKNMLLTKTQIVN